MIINIYFQQTFVSNLSWKLRLLGGSINLQVNGKKKKTKLASKFPNLQDIITRVFNNTTELVPWQKKIVLRLRISVESLYQAGF